MLLTLALNVCESFSNDRANLYDVVDTFLGQK